MANLENTITLKKADLSSLDQIEPVSYSPLESITSQAMRAAIFGNEQKLADADLTTPADEEWIWVDGYKGTQSDMRCNEYQYELGKQFDMPEGSKIEDCTSGFHLCLNLKDVFEYYRIGDGHRFFKVSALVRKKDYEQYGKPIGMSFFGPRLRDKLAAKSIIFTKELTPDEIFEGTEWADKDAEFKSMALSESPYKAETYWMVKGLVKLGYSEPLAKKILDNDDHSEQSVYDLAMALETQPGLNIDTKIIALLAY